MEKKKEIGEEDGDGAGIQCERREGGEIMMCGVQCFGKLS